MSISDARTASSVNRSRTARSASCQLLLLLLLAGLPAGTAAAQDLLRPGEAYVTRFSGVTSTTGADGQPATVINTEGTVGSIIDIRAPRKAPEGMHWVDEPQRKPVTAGEVGQVFGVALDDQNAPNIFLTATAAFGLHRTADNSDWMPGMWGPGGPGAVYVLDRSAGYKPRVFAQVALDGRPNSGAGLGNIAYDRWNKQIFVTDMETGMLHRIRANGSDGGHFDHGVEGRANFLDVEHKQQQSLPPIPFDPATSAQITNCPSGNFAASPECWNIAPSGRRVWGVGVWRNPSGGEVRLYYAVWSSPAFGNSAWTSLADVDKRNSVWSVGLGADGSFNPASVRREFVLPDFFVKPDDIARAGYSQPVSDISFSVCGNLALMVVAERGGMRNLGLTEDNPFAYPHEARALKYELYQDNEWRPVGRYDVGFYDRKNDGQPYIRANCAGGAAFGYDYNESDWTINQGQPNGFVWITGDSLCSPDGPCNLAAAPATAQPAPAATPGQPAAQPAAAPADDPQAVADAAKEQGDDSEVHGVQGMRQAAVDEIAPAASYGTYPVDGTGPYPPAGPSRAYLIDTDINVDADGNLIPDELTRNDATKIGDVAIYEICAAPPAGVAMVLPPAPPPPPPDLTIEVGHEPEFSHRRYYSHGREFSHFRWASHWPVMSHYRFSSQHDRWRSRIHEVRPSRVHNLYISLVHDVRPSYIHETRRSLIHDTPWSRLHDTRPSKVHDLRRSAEHDRRLSLVDHVPLGSHNARLSGLHHVPLGSHLLILSSLGHFPIGSHHRSLSQRSHKPPGSHLVAQSRQTHIPLGSHNPSLSRRHHVPLGSTLSTLPKTPVHVTALSRRGHSPPGSHSVAASKATTTTHVPVGSHNAAQSQATTHKPPGSHSTAASKATTHRPPGSHSTVASKSAVHSAVQSRRTTHSTAASKASSKPTHSAAASRRTTHSTAASKASSKPTHSAAASRRTTYHPKKLTTTKPHVTTTRIKPVTRTPTRHCPAGKKC